MTLSANESSEWNRRGLRVLITLNYGTFDFYAGFIIGIKAFTAAVLGGIGSLPGAMLGGIILVPVASSGAET